jgi:nitrite reductase/ring-hydroxylating ferredoxin subunit
LKSGFLNDHEITCPWHNARFDIWTGKKISAPALDDLASYKVKVEGDSILVKK